MSEVSLQIHLSQVEVTAFKQAANAYGYTTWQSFLLSLIEACGVALSRPPDSDEWTRIEEILNAHTFGVGSREGPMK